MILLFALPAKLVGQTLSGKVVSSTGQPLTGATITLMPEKIALPSDVNGTFRFEAVKKGRHSLRISFVGYKTFASLFIMSSDSLLLKDIILRAEEGQLQEITIKEDYQQLRRQQVSLSMEIVGADYLRRNLGGSLMQSLEKLPGIKTIGIGSGGSKPLIRGLGFNQVVVVENGIRHEGQQWCADHALEIDQFAAGRVEVIKGPSAFLYGSEAIGGAVDIKPAVLPAGHTAGGSADLMAKSNNGLYGGSVNLYARKQRVFADARMTWQEYGDYRVPADTMYVYDYAVPLHENRLRNTAGQERNVHLRTGWLTSQFQSVFYLSHTFSQSGFFANAHGLEPRRVDLDLHDRSSRDMQLPFQQVSHTKIISQSEFRYGQNRFDMELGYQRNFRQEHSQYVNHGYMPPVYPSEQSAPETLERAYDKTVFSANFKNELTYKNHTLTIGTSGEQQRNTIGGWGFLIPAFTQTSAGAFILDKFKVNEKLLLQGALRYDLGRIHIREYNDWFTSQSESGNSTYLTRAEAITRTFKNVNWSAGLNYTPGKFFLKVNAGSSFRMPIAKELAANGINYHYFRYEKGDPSLSAEKSYQLDLGTGINAEKFTAELTPFLNYFPNYIYLNPTARHDYFYGAGNQVFNYAQSRVLRYGSELQLTYRFLSNWNASLAGEYLYTRQLSGAKRGYALPFSPPASALAGITYKPNWDKLLTDAYFTLDCRLTARQNRIVPPERPTPAYQVFSFSAGGKVKTGAQYISVSLQVQNTWNTRYLSHTSFYRLIGLPEAGRNVILAVKIPFVIKGKSTS
ncbi:TonB-dependent receptor [Dyadobacter sediminis]|uniref:TonB-dependent receptor n=1 Tax=Dyadobacter sediminis TaxID=1493691 RepID=A0A5R9KK23_9BACT|nr:TonB-dependent receptor [Dyadobacter sediminis]TLU96570.1 TonB-dependent receptor [Dyadobacter sediminis]GGB83322.1 TonB-dependent receptor [Dyadobacter sediminis]